jgi:hypothetical protein
VPKGPSLEFAQFTHDAFIGSGALDYPWYEEVDFTEPSEGDTRWTLTFTSTGTGKYNPDHVYNVTHTDIMKAVALIATSEDWPDKSPTKVNCKHLQWRRLDAVDFDSESADNVIQVAAFGEVVFA